MPRVEVPITVSKYITMDGLDYRESELSEQEVKRIYAEMFENAMKDLGYTPVKTS